MFSVNNHGSRSTVSLFDTDRIPLTDQDGIINPSPLLTSNVSPLFDSSLRFVGEKSIQQSETFSKINDIHLKQSILEEKINNIQNEMITRDLIDNYKKQIKKFEFLLQYRNCLEELDFFGIFIWRLCSDTHNWKLLARSIYYIERLINNLDNYQIKEFIQKQIKIILDEFLLFVKDLITKQVKLQKQEIKDRITKENQSSRMNDTDVDIILSTTFQEINPQDPIDQHLKNLQSHFSCLKELILTAQERFHICRTDIVAIQTLLKAIEDISFNSRNVDKQDQDRIRLLTLKQDLSQKSNKNDLIQLKIYIDNQIKKIIELNKQNAKELERIKLMKTATSEARHIQRRLSNNSSIHHKKQNRIYSHQSSRPYITFDLDHIRKYQQQALLKSPYGTIPLYRRQAWAAANLYQDQSLHLLRHMQNSVRIQIHHLIGYDPADIYSICIKDKNKNRQKKKSSNYEIFNTDQDLLIVGNDNKLYRGRINSCQIIPLKKFKNEKEKSTIQSAIDENNEIKKIHFDQLDQTIKTIADEHLFEYLDWQAQFNEQDLPDELFEELFTHWKSIVCEEQPCICHSPSELLPCEEEYNEGHHLIESKIDSLSSSSNGVYDDRCICSDCSCQCEKHNEDDSDRSMCLCSQCSCKCFHSENQDNMENINATENNQQESRITEIHVDNELQILDNVIDRVSVVESLSKQFIEDEKHEMNTSDCFINRVDRWTKQFDLFQSNCESTSLSEGNDWSTMNDIPPTVSQFQTAAPIAFALNNISIDTNLPELDDPTAFRQQLLDHDRRQHEQIDTKHEHTDQSYVDNTKNQQFYLQPIRRRIHRRELNNNTSLNLFESKPVFLK